MADSRARRDFLGSSWFDPTEIPELALRCNARMGTIRWHRNAGALHRFNPDGSGIVGEFCEDGRLRLAIARTPMLRMAY